MMVSRITNKLILLLFSPLCLMLLSCNKNNIQHEIKEVHILAEQFLKADLNIQGIGIVDLQTVTGELEKSYNVQYGFSDFTGDSIPEFYVTNGRRDYIFKKSQKTLEVWKSFEDSSHYIPLNDGSLLIWTAYATEDHFVHQRFDESGNILENTKYSIDYSGENPSYSINNIVISKEKWFVSVRYFYDSEGNFVNQLPLETYNKQEENK